jgi:hypothetical protein
VGRRFIILFAALSGMLLGSYFLLRALFVPQGWGQATTSVPSPGIVLKNVGTYAFALLLPVDSVLANEWLRTPLPSEIELDVSAVITAGALAMVTLLGLTLVIWRWARSNSIAMPKLDWVAVSFLVCGIAAPLLPVLLFTSHPSETYLYLPAAFYAVLLSYVLDRLLLGSQASKGRIVYAVTVVVLLGLFSAAAWVKNQQVVQRGEIAQRILSGLPDTSLMNGVQTVHFAYAPGEPVTHQYGLYGGGHGHWPDHAIESALQLVYQNELVTGEVVEPEELVTRCQPASSSPYLCLWIHWDGRVEAVLP